MIHPIKFSNLVIYNYIRYTKYDKRYKNPYIGVNELKKIKVYYNAIVLKKDLKCLKYRVFISKCCNLSMVMVNYYFIDKST